MVRYINIKSRGFKWQSRNLCSLMLFSPYHLNTGPFESWIFKSPVFRWLLYCYFFLQMSTPPQVSVQKCCFQSFPQPASNNSGFMDSDQLRKDLGSELSRKDLGSDCNSKASDSGEDTEGSGNTST